MLSHTILLIALGALVTATQLLYQFPSPPAGRYINIENVAVRKTGSLLLNIATGPQMYQLNPAYPVPELLVYLPGPIDSLTGIAETCPGSDVFAVGAGNFTFGPQVPGGLAGIPGTFSVWTVDLTGPQAVPKQVAAIPEASALNGATAIPGLKNIILVADSGLGAVWSVNIETGEYYIAIQDPMFLPNTESSLGINGVHVRGSVLYWTNSAQGSFGKVQLGISDEGHVGAVGAAEKIASPPSSGFFFDDFAFDYKGNAWIATHPNAVTVVSPSGSLSYAAGGGNDTTLLSPTSTAFDLSGCILYIVTGGQGGPPGMEVSGQVFTLDTCEGGKKWKA